MAVVKTTFWHGLIKQNSGKLDTVERINEVIFGLIMVLTFTCTINIATECRNEVRLYVGHGCNVAWGIIDSFIYIFSVMMYRGISMDAVHLIRNAPTDTIADEAIRDALPPVMGLLLKDEHYSYFRSEIKKLPAPPHKTIVTWNDILGAVKTFLLVFISTFPVAIPFIFMTDIFLATRVSNSIALALLFATG
ncbi:MAG: VIT family protein [Chitinophagaceae bacterium]|nr:VIT family protein [Chitinophagaceae bacterium]